MILIEELAHKLAGKMALQLGYDEERKSVIAYGLMAILQMTIISVMISIIGVIFGFWFESMIILLGVGITRKSTGGAHASSMNSCIIISILSISILSGLSRYILSLPINIYINIGISFIIYMMCLIVFYIRVPVDTPNKPIVKPEKIKRLRKQSFFIITIGFLISIIFVILTIYNNRFYSIAMSIRLAMLWQLFTLTKSGAYVLHKVDSFITMVVH